MKTFKMAVGIVVIAGGLGLASGGFFIPGGMRDVCSAPVGKCRGACRMSDPARDLEALIGGITDRCGNEQTLAGVRYRLLFTTYEGTGATPFRE